LHPYATVYGIDSNEKHLEEALALGVVDAAASMDNLSDADFVILSVPVDVALTVLKVLDVIGDNSIVLK
jgi:prephenate dehydrogenase